MCVALLGKKNDYTSFVSSAAACAILLCILQYYCVYKFRYIFLNVNEKTFLYQILLKIFDKLSVNLFVTKVS